VTAFVTTHLPESKLGTIGTLVQLVRFVRRGEVWRVNPGADAGHEITTFEGNCLTWSGTEMFRVRVQPPERTPSSPEASSTTNNCHVPVGSVPSKTDKEGTALELPGGTGAGKSKRRGVNLAVGR
jgi:hypothetical protein